MCTAPIDCISFIYNTALREIHEMLFQCCSLLLAFSWNIFEKCKLESDKAKHNRSLHTLFASEKERKLNSVHVLVLWIKKSGGKKSKHFLSIHYIAQNAKWEMKRKNSFLVISRKRLQCLPVTLNLYFAAFPDYKALFIVISWKWKFDFCRSSMMEADSAVFGDHQRSIMRLEHRVTVSMSNLASTFTCVVLLISSLFIIPSRSLSSIRFNGFMRIASWKSRSCRS